MGERRLGYVPALDGVRAVAIAGVTGAHFFGLPGGNFGVDVFFVLSGFLITTLLLEEHATTGAINLRAFYVRRARRLFPALGGLIAVTALCGAMVYPTGRLIEMVAAAVFYVANIVRATSQGVLDGTPLGHLWSLAMEEQFYLVWPLILILLLGRRVPTRRIAIGLAALFVALVVYRAGLVAAGGSQHRIYHAPDTHADGLVAGCVLAFLRLRGFRPPRWLAWPALAAIAISFGVIGSWRFNITTEVPIVELVTAALILAVTVVPGSAAAALSLPPVVWLGKISYTLYVWQQFGRWITASDGWPAWLATAILTLFSYYLLEKPFRERRPQHDVEPITAPAAISTA